MRVSAKADYAVRAMVELAAEGVSPESPLKGQQIGSAQLIPLAFLENILGELRHHGLVQSQRGYSGGYWLARPSAQITIADVIRAVEGPLATVRGEAPDEIDYPAGSEPLREVWLALRASIRSVLETVTIADLVGDQLPGEIVALTRHPDATRPDPEPSRAGGER